MAPNIKLILGDCLQEMKKIPNKSIDLVLTDPPYGLNIVGKSNLMGKATIGVQRMAKLTEWDCSNWDASAPPPRVF